MKKLLEDKRTKNTWAVVPISELPDDVPVLGVTHYPDKSFAQFHLVEYALLPKEISDKLKAKSKAPVE